MTFDEVFSTFEGRLFPERRENNVIYAVGIEFNERFVPFYVGQTRRSIGGRIGDYASAQIKAKTDFKVGEAVKILRGLKPGLKVKVKFKNASKEPKERRREEAWLKGKVEEEFKSKQFSSDLLNAVKLKYNQSKPTDADRNLAIECIEKWARTFLQDLDEYFKKIQQH